MSVSSIDPSSAVSSAQGAALGQVSQGFQTATQYASNSWTLLTTKMAALLAALDTFEVPAIENINFDGVNPDDILNEINSVGEVPDFSEIRTMLNTLNGLPSVPPIPTPDDLQDFPTIRTNLADSLMDSYRAKMADLIADGGTGLGADVEADIWQRVLDRQELEVQRMFEETESFFAARGFTLPPGALSGRLNEINIEIGRRRDQANMDIGIEQARLAQTNTHFILQEIQKFVLQQTLQEIQMIATANEGKLKKYETSVSAFRAVIEGLVSAVNAQVQLFAAFVERHKSLIALASAKINALVQAAQMQLEVAKLDLTKVLKVVDVELEAEKAKYAAKVEAAKTMALVAGQTVAAALSSMHATASVGSSGNAAISASVNKSDSYDMTKSVPSGPTTATFYNYNY